MSLVSTLGRLVEDAAARQMRSPAILIVGNVLTAFRDRNCGANGAAPGGEPPARYRPVSEA